MVLQKVMREAVQSGSPQHPHHRPHHHLWMWLLLLLFCCVQTTFLCPRDCFCEPHSKNVHCANKGLTSIPEGIPLETIELVLNQNLFHNPDLTRRNFTGLVKLQKLYMSKCGIETIALDTFTDLADLVWLDISGNKISYIADYTFRGLKLKHLFMNDNKDIQLSAGAFAGMTTSGLYMHNCEISKLSVSVMAPLNNTLRTLWLDSNMFETFSEDWLALFSTLGHLRLGKNPFHCNCEIGWLHKFFTKHTSVFSGGDHPSCASPILLRNKRFSNLTADDFRCELPTFRNVDALFDTEMGKLTCQARGDPTPTLYWIRPDGTTETYYPSQNEDTNENEGVMYMANIKLIDSARYKCVASNPAGNVTFSLNVAWPPPPTASPTTTPTTTSTTATTKSMKDDNVIVADATSSPSGRQYRDQENQGSPYDWGVNKPEMKLGSKAEEDVASKSGAKDPMFTLVDVVGAVVGTFLMTVLACVVVAQLYWRRKERLRQEDHYSVPDSKPPLAPARLYIMGEDGENRIRMLSNHGHTDGPT